MTSFFAVGSFLNPSLAAVALGLALIVPIVIHLLFRQRERIVVWAAMRFLPSATRKMNRRIDNWPLLLLRIAATLLPLAAMLAVLPAAERLWQLAWPGALEASLEHPRTHTIIILDASLSMTSQPESDPIFETARRKALDLLDAAQPGDGFSLIVMALGTDVRIPGPTNRIDSVREEILRIEPCHGPADLPGAILAASDILKRSPSIYPRRQTLIFSDRQRAEFSAVLPLAERPTSEELAKLAMRSDVAVIDVGRDGLDNLAVVDFALADPLPIVESPVLVTATVRNYSPRDRNNVPIELLLARPGTNLSVVAKKVLESIPAGGQTSLSFMLEGASCFRTVGPHALQVRLSESDALSADNLRTLAFEVRDTLNVLLVNGHPAGNPLRRASEFLSEALAPGGRQSPGNPFRPRTVSVEEFQDATLTDLSAVDCVVLCDVPSATPSQVARLEALLKRGGGIILGLGPNAAANRELYNRLLGPGGAGFIPGRLGEAVSSLRADIRLSATDSAYRQPPLAAFQDANARAALSGVPFRSYVRLESDTDSPGTRILSFAAAGVNGSPDVALVETLRHRGRVLVFTSTFHREWTDWPVLPSFLPFVHELVRHAVANRDPRTLTVGEAIEDIFAATAVGKIAVLTRPDGKQESMTICSAEGGGIVRFSPAMISGLYRIDVAEIIHPIAVNAPPTASGLGESDLRRVDVSELAALNVQVVNSPDEVKSTFQSETSAVLMPRARGPAFALSLATLGVCVLVLELFLAWRLGPARRSVVTVTEKAPSTLSDRLIRLVGWFLVAGCAITFVIVFHGLQTGDLPDWIPATIVTTFEKSMEVPEAGPGEGTRWRFATTMGSWLSDQWLIVALIVLIVGTGLLYRREWSIAGRQLLLPLLLRLNLYGLLFLVVLPQLRIVFEREGYPEIALVLDTSASMATVDPGHDTSRLSRVQDWLIRDDGKTLSRLVQHRRFRLQIYSLAEQTALTTIIEDANDLEQAIQKLANLAPNGPATRLGDGIESVLKAHRGSALAAVIIASDGITTQGTELSTAGRIAARNGVPLFTVGVGDRQEALDLALADLKLDDVVAKGDEMIIEGRLQTRGILTEPITITLHEQVSDQLTPLARTTVSPDSSGKPLPFKLKHTPTTTGDKTLVIETPVLPGERDPVNNRLQHTVLVTEGKKLRVLLIDGRSRYEFRFLKSLFEREVDSPTERSLDFRFLLLDAGKDFATIDRSALRSFPSRAELFEYDAVILGDVDPNILPRPETNLADLGDFVRTRGGGLLLIAGEQAMPSKYFDSPISDLLPLLPASDLALPSREDQPLTEGYRLQLTPLGHQHPLLRLASDDHENVAIWQRLAPMLWCAGGYLRKQTTEILAQHPSRVIEQEPHPLILQQFVGVGRVLFFGFDESWRWRYRRDEETYNRFWRQAVRVLARNRVARIEIRSDKPGPYRRDEPIVLTVRFPDDAPPPTGPVKLGLERTTPDGDRETVLLALNKLEGQRATYQSTLSRTPEGKYRFRLVEPTDAGRSSTLDLSVVSPPGESERLEMNVLELSRAASESGGKYYPMENAASLPEDLPEGVRVPLNQPCPPVTLWNLPLTFAVILTLLALEWLLRKRSRLL